MLFMHKWFHCISFFVVVHKLKRKLRMNDTLRALRLPKEYTIKQYVNQSKNQCLLDRQNIARI